MVKKHLYLEEETLELIEVFRVENNISTLSKAVNTLVKKYNENCNSTVNNLNKYIANAVVEEIKSDLLKEVSSTIKNEVKQLNHKFYQQNKPLHNMSTSDSENFMQQH